MAFYPVFLTVVCVARNRADELEATLGPLGERLSQLVADYELVVVDNASQDASVATLKRLTGEQALPNLQVYALTKEVDTDTASWVGIENALGDFVAVLDPFTDDPAVLPEMLDHAVSGADVVFAANRIQPALPLAYRLSQAAFHRLYQWVSGIHLIRQAPQYRILSRSVVNFILRHPQPAVSYRHLPASAGFARASVSYASAPRAPAPKRLWDSIDRGMRLLVSSTRAPMRLVTALSLFGAAANLLYSGYVVAVALVKPDVAPGWTSLSLQQSGMFFLISLVLLVLGEYILHMASLSGEGPPYHVGQEFTSARITRRQRLNVEEAVAAPATPRPQDIAA